MLHMVPESCCLATIYFIENCHD